MAFLTIHQGLRTSRYEFTPPMSLASALSDAGIFVSKPCGGRGSCGKCAVLLSGDTSLPNHAERIFGSRLACQAILQGDAEVSIPVLLPMQQIEGGHAEDRSPLAPMDGHYGAAIDIGTTTIALLLYDLTSGRCIGSASMLNPQTSIAADVIGRIEAALNGRTAELQHQVESSLLTLLSAACADAETAIQSVDSLVITGNTTMLYLLTGRNPLSLSRAPFEADCYFGSVNTLLSRRAYLPRCLHAFVGADTTCAILASGMTTREETSLLCDVGTNGELALWHQGHLYIASTAAGPAFEGAGISCGCASVLGAIDRVEIIGDAIQCHTIGHAKPIGLCGSGLLDAVSALLKLEIIDETGYMEDESYSLTEDLVLKQSDIRAVQLAKAATHAGIMSLLSAAGCSEEDVSTLYLAGGFGSHLNIRSAAHVGLFPEALTDRVRVIGNAALDGAAMLLMNISAREEIEQLTPVTHHVRLDGNPEFSERYINAMMFE